MDESFWGAVLRMENYQERMQELLGLTDEQSREPLKTSLFHNHSLFEKCCEVLRTSENEGALSVVLPLSRGSKGAHVPLSRNTTIPGEIRMRYIQCGNGATAKLALLKDGENVKILMNQMLFALDVFFQLVFLERAERPWRIYWDSKWGPLWYFLAPLTIHKSLPFQSLYQEMMWLTLHNKLPLENDETLPLSSPMGSENEMSPKGPMGPTLSAKGHTILHIQFTLWLQGVLTLINGEEPLLARPPFLRLRPECETPRFPASFVFAQGEDHRPIPELRKWARRKMRNCLAQGELCTYHVTGPTSKYLQPQWVCLTCGYGVENDYFICHNCALQHDCSHRLLFRGIATGFCDGGIIPP
jgi:hypothetical protein